jgi:hypothetical protein
MDIYVADDGCHSKDFKCQMCHPFVAQFSQLILDNCKICARSKIAKGLISYYFVNKYAWDIQSGKKVVVERTLIEKWRDSDLK